MLPVSVPRGKRPELKDIPKDVPQKIIELIVTCWHQEPDERLDFTGALTLRFLIDFFELLK